MNEGDLCGIVHYLARVVFVSLGSCAALLWRILSRVLRYLPYDTASSVFEKEQRYALITINGKPLGWANISNGEAASWVSKVREYRRAGLIDRTVEVVWRNLPGASSVIRILCDPQRPLRVFIVLKNWLQWLSQGSTRTPIRTMQDFFELGLVEFVGPAEMRALSIGFSWQDMITRAAKSNECFTHCEVDAAFMYGTSAESIPFPDKNQSPRNTYQSVMAKQGIGYSLNQPLRIQGSTAHYLFYGERPLVSSALTPNKGEAIHGLNLVTVINTDRNTQEDNNGFCKTPLQMGAMRSFSHRCYIVTQKKSVGNVHAVEKMKKPDVANTIGLKSLRHEGLQENGLPFLGSIRCTGDAMAGRTITVTKLSKSAQIDVDIDAKEEYTTMKERDESIETRVGDCGGVSRLLIHQKEGQYMAKIYHTCLNLVQVGDKFCMTADHECLTKDRGWITIDKVTRNDWIATLQAKTGRVVWQKPRALYRYDHAGALIQIRNSQVDLCVTPEHEMYVNGRLIKAKSLPESGFFQDMAFRRLPYNKMDDVQTEKKVPVYCIEVPNHIFYVRRNGKACWTGNSSRHGQKHTLAPTIANEDMMQDERTGETPDAYTDSICFASRMTMAHTHEMDKALQAIIDCRVMNGRAFVRDEVVQTADSQAYAFSGYRWFINGKTGRVMRAPLFRGLNFEQKLKHMSSDKVHARAQGPVHLLTGQPVEARSHDGGLRFGEMENGCLIAYGAAMNHDERNGLCAGGGGITWICSRCGIKGTANPEEHLYKCGVCGSGDYLTPIQQPKAPRLFYQEAEALHFLPRFWLTDKNDPRKRCEEFVPTLANLLQNPLPPTEVLPHAVPEIMHALFEICGDSEASATAPENGSQQQKKKKNKTKVKTEPGKSSKVSKKKKWKAVHVDPLPVVPTNKRRKTMPLFQS